MLFRSALKDAIKYTGITPKIIRSDNAGEFESEEFIRYCENRDVPIMRQWSAPHHQYQNGLSEQSVRKVSKMMLVLLLQSGLPVQDFWPFALAHGVNILNHLPHASLLNNTTPLLRAKRSTFLELLHPFGCRITVMTPDLQESHTKIGRAHV